MATALDPHVCDACVVNSDGEALVFNPDNGATVLCTHAFCQGYVDRIKVSSFRDALRCRSCGLRIIVPCAVKTFDELRRHFEQFNDT